MFTIYIKLLYLGYSWFRLLSVLALNEVCRLSGLGSRTVDMCASVVFSIAAAADDDDDDEGCKVVGGL